MRIKIDEASDALYFRLIEILGIKGRIPLEELKRLQFETV